jgi:Ca2+-binding EF-hand superfamily protein
MRGFRLLGIPVLGLFVAACAPVTEGVVSGASQGVTQEVLETFEFFDDDESGDISSAEYDEDADRFGRQVEFDEMDTDGDGFVSEEEFGSFENDFDF